MTNDTVDSLEELTFRSLVIALRTSGVEPAVNLPDEFDILGDDDRRVLAFLIARKASVAGNAARDTQPTAAAAPSSAGVSGETSPSPAAEPNAKGHPDTFQDDTDNRMANEITLDDVGSPVEGEEATEGAAPPQDTPASPKPGSDTSLDDSTTGSDTNRDPAPTEDIALPAPPETSAVSEDIAPPGMSDARDPHPAPQASDNASDPMTQDTNHASSPIESPMPRKAGHGPGDDPDLEKGPDVINGLGGIPKIGPDPRPEPDRVSLPNGRAGTDYSAHINGYSGIRLRDDNGTGLEISPDGTVSGAPVPAGEYKLLLNALKQGRSVEIVARLSVIPRPQDLWKNLPSDQEASLAKPDEASDLQSGQALVVAASKRGRSHAQDGSYRDDHFEIDASPDTGWHIMIVADGAGSASLSREGSRVACQAAMSALKSMLPAELDPHLPSILVSATENPDTWKDQVLRDHLYQVLPQAAFRAVSAISQRSDELAKPSSELATTLIIAIAKKIDEQWFIASFTLGDGGVAIYDATHASVRVMCSPDSGEFAGQTRFLAASEFSDPHQVMQRIFVDLRPDFTALFAMTDGITDPKLPTDALFANQQSWSALWHDDLANAVAFEPDNPNLQHQLLDWLDFWSRGNHDDRTIAILVPLDETSGKTGDASNCADTEEDGGSHEEAPKDAAMTTQEHAPVPAAEPTENNASQTPGEGSGDTT